jgi:hypothetical protein
LKGGKMTYEDLQHMLMNARKIIAEYEQKYIQYKKQNRELKTKVIEFLQSLSVDCPICGCCLHGDDSICNYSKIYFFSSFLFNLWVILWCKRSNRKSGIFLMKRTKQYNQIMFPEEKKKALKWGLSKFITLSLQLTEANFRKAKRYIIELKEGQK